MKLWWNGFIYKAASSETVSTDSQHSLCICPHLSSEKNAPTLLFHLLVLFDIFPKWKRFQDCFDSPPTHLSFSFQIHSNMDQRVLSEFIIPNWEQNSPDTRCDLRVIIIIIGSHFTIISYLNVFPFCYCIVEFLPVTIIILNFYLLHFSHSHFKRNEIWFKRIGSTFHYRCSFQGCVHLYVIAYLHLYLDLYCLSLTVHIICQQSLTVIFKNKVLRKYNIQKNRLFSVMLLIYSRRYMLIM